MYLNKAFASLTVAFSKRESLGSRHTARLNVCTVHCSQLLWRSEHKSNKWRKSWGPNGDPVHNTKKNLDLESKLKKMLNNTPLYLQLTWFDVVVESIEILRHYGRGGRSVSSNTFHMSKSGNFHLFSPIKTSEPYLKEKYSHGTLNLSMSRLPKTRWQRYSSSTASEHIALIQFFKLAKEKYLARSCFTLLWTFHHSSPSTDFFESGLPWRSSDNFQFSNGRYTLYGVAISVLPILG